MLWQRLFATESSYAGLAARLALGLVILAHGAQKAFGWFGGYGFEGTMGFFTESLGLPWLIGFLVILAEVGGALALVAGFGTRFFAAVIGLIMVFAVAMVHGRYGFFMNWSGAQAGEGFEFHILAIGLAIALFLTGGGAFSADRALARR